MSVVSELATAGSTLERALRFLQVTDTGDADEEPQLPIACLIPFAPDLGSCSCEHYASLRRSLRPRQYRLACSRRIARQISVNASPSPNLLQCTSLLDVFPMRFNALLGFSKLTLVEFQNSVVITEFY